MAESLDDFVAGWLSGAVATVATQPLDLYLTRYQAATLIKPAHAAVPQQPANTVRSLWRGTLPLVLGAPLNNALIFWGYGMGKLATDESMGRLAPVFAGGCIGGFLQSFAASPIELLKVRMQLLTTAGGVEVAAHASESATARAHLASLCATGHSHALPPLFSQGLSATIWRDALPHGVWFASYEAAKGWWAERLGLDMGETSLPLGPQLSAGSFAATLAWGVGYPFDVLKTRCQAAPSDSAPSLVEAARVLHAEGGLVAFYRGFGLKLCRAVPMSMIGFLAYERALEVLQRLREQRA